MNGPVCNHSHWVQVVCLCRDLHQHIHLRCDGCGFLRRENINEWFATASEPIGPGQITETIRIDLTRDDQLRMYALAQANQKRYATINGLVSSITDLTEEGVVIAAEKFYTFLTGK